MRGPEEFPQIICDDCMKVMSIRWIDTGSDDANKDFLLAVCHDVEYLLEPAGFYEGIYGGQQLTIKGTCKGKLVKSNLATGAYNSSWLSAERLAFNEGQSLRVILRELRSLILYNRVRVSQGAAASMTLSEADFNAIVDALMLYRPQQPKAE